MLFFAVFLFTASQAQIDNGCYLERVGNKSHDTTNFSYDSKEEVYKHASGVVNIVVDVAPCADDTSTINRVFDVHMLLHCNVYDVLTINAEGSRLVMYTYKSGGETYDVILECWTFPDKTVYAYTEVNVTYTILKSETLVDCADFVERIVDKL